MINKDFKIWGRTLSLEVIYDVYDDEEILSGQVEALNLFLEKAEELLSDSSAIEKYCVENSNGEISTPVDNIYKYVMPSALYILRETDHRTVALLCDFKFDEEHGCSLVFENEQFVRVCSQDDI